MATAATTAKEREDKLNEAFAAIEAMQKNFESVKQGYQENIQQMANMFIGNVAKFGMPQFSDTNRPLSKKEYFDEPSALELKIKRLAALVRKSKHFVVFTGAGISTSCGIGDFRSGLDTVLKTGAGKWTKDDAVKEGKWTKELDKKSKQWGKKRTSTFKAIPSPSHMALIALAKAGYLKHLVSQNTDGLHRRSGFPINQLSELHGNSTLEVCSVCEKAYMRDEHCRHKSNYPSGAFAKLKHLADKISADLASKNYPLCPDDVAKMKGEIVKINKAYRTLYGRNPEYTTKEAKEKRQELYDEWELMLEKSGHKVPRYLHQTGRRCTVKGCNGKLEDTIINFHEPLPAAILQTAENESDEADLYLVLGSSCMVYPAAGLPKDVGFKWMKEKDEEKMEEPVHNLCIVNIQQTPLHHLSSLPIHAKIDDVMIGVMKELELKIPQWLLTRYMRVNVSHLNAKQKRLIISGCDIDGTPFSLFKRVLLRQNGKRLIRMINNKEHKEHEFDFIVDDWREEKEDENGLCAELSFYGNYKEPKLSINLNEYLDEFAESEGEGQIVLKLMMNPFSKEWIVPNKKEQAMDKNVKSLWFVGGDHVKMMNKRTMNNFKEKFEPLFLSPECFCLM